MPHGRGIITALIAIEREAARAKARAAKEMDRVERDRERRQIAAEKELAQLSQLNEKERTRIAHERLEQEAEAQNRELTQTITDLAGLLRGVLDIHHRLNFDALKKPLHVPDFVPGRLAEAEDAPAAELYRPKKPSLFARLIPGSKGRYQRALRESRIKFDEAMTACVERENKRQIELGKAKTKHADERKSSGRKWSVNTPRSTP